MPRTNSASAPAAQKGAIIINERRHPVEFHLNTQVESNGEKRTKIERLEIPAQPRRKPKGIRKAWEVEVDAATLAKLQALDAFQGMVSAGDLTVRG